MPARARDWSSCTCEGIAHRRTTVGLGGWRHPTGHIHAVCPRFSPCCAKFPGARPRTVLARRPRLSFGPDRAHAQSVCREPRCPALSLHRPRRRAQHEHTATFTGRFASRQQRSTGTPGEVVSVFGAASLDVSSRLPVGVPESAKEPTNGQSELEDTS